ncbi:MAG: hypothetical protein H6654_00505 [Ardenticatenaceae bacterium]|nr:hypothetical protein [Ardenticatenaceae bacterium]
MTTLNYFLRGLATVVDDPKRPFQPYDLLQKASPCWAASSHQMPKPLPTGSSWPSLC